MPVVVLIVILRALRRQRGGACSDSAGELESDAGSGASALATPTSTTLKDGHPGPNGACITRQAIPSGLGSACDDRVQQPVALIRQPQIRDMKVCLELRQLPQILVGSYSLVGLDTWAWFFGARTRRHSPLYINNAHARKWVPSASTTHTHGHAQWQ